MLGSKVYGSTVTKMDTRYENSISGSHRVVSTLRNEGARYKRTAV